MPKLSRFSVLNRLLNRTDNTVIATLHSHCIGRPLFIEPNYGERILGAYMQGAVDEVGEREAQTTGKIAIMNINGALASRPMPGPSGLGPMNYEEMRDTFDELVARADIEAIVLRMDSPGGFADGMLDLTDRIVEARDTKPIHAVVEHMAYSAAYGIAAAAEQIWVTRTSGTGSVGVVAYHVDQSARDEADGFKVTPIFAGARKIDYSPHFPISEEALERAQADIDRHYGMFVDAVAAYRGMSADNVRKTEAAVYTGQAGIDVGFADRLGTIYDALSFLSGGEDTDAPEPVDTREDDAMNDTTDADKAKTEEQRIRGAVASAVLNSNLPDALQTVLMKADIGEDKIEARLEHANTMNSLCEVAGRSDLAVSFVKNNLSVDDARKQLTELRAASQQDVDVTLRAGGGGSDAGPTKINAASVYQSRRKDVERARQGGSSNSAAS